MFEEEPSVVRSDRLRAKIEGEKNDNAKTCELDFETRRQKEPSEDRRHPGDLKDHSPTREGTSA